MENSIRILFWLYKSKANSKGLAPLFMRLTVNGTKTEVSTGLQLSAKSWNVNTGSIRGSSNEAKEMNKRIDLLKGAALKAYNGLTEQDLPITAEQVKNRLAQKEQQSKTLLEAFAFHNNMMAKKVGIETAKATLDKYLTLQVKVKQFLTDEMGRTDIYLKDLNHQFILEFETYLKVNQQLSHNTAIKYVQFTKKIIHLSLANSWINVNPFKNFRCSLITKERGYLTMDEIKTITNKPINLGRLHLPRLIFIFSCYTGLSYADMKKLCCKHIETKEDGRRWIVLNRQKTGVRSAIPLLPQALEILDRFEPPFIPDLDLPLLPMISNQKMNVYLKEIGEFCGINKRLTFHLARHSFATSVTMSHGVDISSISKMLGHVSLKTTQHYCKVVDTKVQDDMKRLEEKLYA